MDAQMLPYFSEINKKRDVKGERTVSGYQIMEVTFNLRQSIPRRIAKAAHYRMIKTVVPDPAKRDAPRQRQRNITFQGE